MFRLNRRAFLAGASSLAGCALSPLAALAQEQDTVQVDASEVYAAVQGEPFPVPAIDLNRIDDSFLRSVVAYDSGYAPGTIVIDPAQRYLYLTSGDGSALRYGVGVGKEGFAWSGTARIHDKREWPDWYPPKEMLARRPDIMDSMSQLQSGIGMHGGPGNPLGARAMYLFQGNKDTLFRIHGTIEPWTIGSRVSSGCIRMINQDVMDLYQRVPVGTDVIVLGSAQPTEQSRPTRRRHREPRYDPQAQADPDTQPGDAVPPPAVQVQ